MNVSKVKELLKALKATSRESAQLNINELRIVLALERAIARLQFSKDLADHLVYKGGLVLLKHFGSSRFTRDADALAVGISKKRISRNVISALECDLDDGLWFGDVRVKSLEEQGKYGALRFDTAFQIGVPEQRKIHKLSRIHIDIGFSDQLLGKVKKETMSSIFPIDHPVSWKVYPSEQIIAEKLEILFARGSGNSRARDIYDLLHLFSKIQNKKILLPSIQKIFEIRGTPRPLSFCSEARSFDLSILEAAWPGVKILGNKSSFIDAWNALLEHLEALDNAI